MIEMREELKTEAGGFKTLKGIFLTQNLEFDYNCYQLNKANFDWPSLQEYIPGDKIFQFSEQGGKQKDRFSTAIKK
jgi:hypothetical protein